MVSSDNNRAPHPVVDDEDWAQTPDSAKSLVSAMQERVVGLEQQIQEWEANIYVRTLPYLLSVIRKHWLLITFMFVATVVICVYPASKRIPVYQSTATLLIKFGREYIYRPEIGGSEGLISRSRQAALNTEVEILSSFRLSQRVVQTIGPKKLYPYLSTALPTSQQPLADIAAQIFQGNFSVNLLRDSDVIRVAFRHPDPTMSAMAVNVAVERFKEEHLRVFSNPQATAFLEQKVAAYREQLDQIDEKIRAFQAEHQFFFLRDEGKHAHQQRASLEAALSQIRNEIVGLRDKLLGLEAERETIKQSASLVSPPDRDVSDLAAQLRQLMFKQVELLRRYRPNHPQVRDIRDEIQQVRVLIAEAEDTKRPSRFYQEVEMAIINSRIELDSKEAREADLELQLDQTEVELQNYLLQKQGYHDLKSERDIIEKAYRTYLNKAKQARLSEEMNNLKIANISVIQPGFVPRGPINLSKKRVIAIGILLGIILGLGSAFAVEAVKSANQTGVHENATWSAARKHSSLPSSEVRRAELMHSD